MTYLLILLPIAAIIIWLVRKERSRRVQTQRNEEEFLAAMRANPLAKSAALEPRPEAPLLSVTPAMRASAPAQPVPVIATSSSGPEPVLPIDVTPSGLPVPDITPRVAASAPLGAPRDGRCMVCGEAVDVRASDQSRWGVKIPEPGSERLAWVHFHCLAGRLLEGQKMRSALADLVTALDSGAGSAASSSLDQALQHAKRELGQ